MKSKEKGQSLVELAIILPLLLMMFLGLIEVGWAIRGYLTLLIGNWNAARYGARNDIELDANYFDIVSNEFYDTVDLPLTLDNSSLRITLVTFEVENPCITTPAIITDTIIYTEGITQSAFIDIAPIANKVAQEESLFQCQLYQRNPETYWNKGHQLLIIETHYSQPQLLGFPFFTMFGDELLLKTYTKIRKL